mmetsp:Transcript_1045/g.1593  ORF Transcript_1045/g.1593 Transcript_1045/m.1593 type:complete len:155 (-) Transcript_1045:28-492(-)
MELDVGRDATKFTMDMGMDKMSMMMPMSFWSGTDLTWLINGWDSTNAGQYTGGLIVTFIVALVLESLVYLRNYTYIKAQIAAIRKTEDLNRDIPRIIVDLSLGSRLLLTVNYILMATLAYCIMLLVMTFNYPILLVLVFGLAVAHFITETIGLP